MQIINAKPVKRVMIQWGNIEWCAEIYNDNAIDLQQALAQAEIFSRAEAAEARAAQLEAERDAALRRIESLQATLNTIDHDNDELRRQLAEAQEEIKRMVQARRGDLSAYMES